MSVRPAGALPLPVRLVLVRPRNAMNLGAAARAMKNCGLQDWAWVDPQVDDLATARVVAVHARELLDAAPTFARLDEAVGDCIWVVGTSSRRTEGKRRLAPRAVAEEVLARAAHGRTALVFGDERSGLTRAEVDRCHDLSGIPTAPEQPSVNLAQAVLLYAYELRVAALERAELPPPPRAALATDADLARLEDALRRALERSGFLTDGRLVGVRRLAAPLRRSLLTRAETRLWLAALESLARLRTT